MNYEAVTAFGSIESAQEYLGLLAQVILESQQAAEADIEANRDSGSPRLVEALQLVTYNLEKLAYHTKTSRRILNDLRILRRLLLREQEHSVGSPE